MAHHRRSRRRAGSYRPRRRAPAAQTSPRIEMDDLAIIEIHYPQPVLLRGRQRTVGNPPSREQNGRSSLDARSGIVWFQVRLAAARRAAKSQHGESQCLHDRRASATGAAAAPPAPPLGAIDGGDVRPPAHRPFSPTFFDRDGLRHLVDKHVPAGLMILHTHHHIDFTLSVSSPMGLPAWRR